MARQQGIYVYDIPSIPDCTHHSLVTLCGGNVREHIFRASEHLLRMIANFQEGQITLAIRFIFNPQTDNGIQQRLRLQLAIKIGPGVSSDTVEQLIESGPLTEFYEFKRTEGKRPLANYSLEHDFPLVCEVIRQEERVDPAIKDRKDTKVRWYYSPHLFEARQDNDYLMVDTLLSRMKNPCVIELLVCPVDQSKDFKRQFDYYTALMSVNDLKKKPQTIKSGASSSESRAKQQTVIDSEVKKDPMADDFAREHQKFNQQLRQPQMLFNIKVYAMSYESALMLASAVAECGFSKGQYQLLAYGNNIVEMPSELIRQSLRDSCNMDISLKAMCPKMWTEELSDSYYAMSRLCRMATVEEVKGIFRLPVGGYGSPRCIRKKTDPKPATQQKSILIGDDMESDDPPERDYKKNSSNLNAMFNCSKPTNIETVLPLSILTKHMFVAGVPGSGKTTAVFNILVQLYRQGIPFLVIEPAKTEYRILKTLTEHPDPIVRKMAEELRIYTPGNDMISPLRFNPLFFPEGVTLDEHISQVLSCFDAAMPLGGPLQALIAEAVETVYQGHEKGSYPGMVDLLDAARETMQRNKYKGELHSNLSAAIELRIGLLTRRAMGRIFQGKNCMPSVDTLLKHPTIIEMDYLSQDHACLLTLFLLSAVREHIKINPDRQSSGLHHVTVIEEAHNIVGRSGSAKVSEEAADPKAFAAQYVARMLAELRALGEGIIIADQLPSAVAPEVVRNTGTKLAHRLVSNEDRDYIGGSMLLGGPEIEEIARLDPGQAYFYTEGLYKPRRVRCLDANSYLKLGKYPHGQSIVSYLEGQSWFFENQADRDSLIPKLVDKLIESASCLIAKYDGKLTRLQDELYKFNRINKRSDSEQYKKASERMEINAGMNKTEIQKEIAPINRQFSDFIQLSDSYNENTRKSVEMYNAHWQEKLYPRLDKLEKDFYTIESQLSKNQIEN